METRVIEVKVNGCHLSKSSNLAGVQGESKVTAMRIEFDDGWDGYAKVITWLDAKGEVATQVVLTVADSGLSTLEAERVYMTLIPGEAMTHVGENMFAIDGYISGKRQKSVYGKLIVRPGDDFSDVRGNEIDWEEVTPEIALQIQAQIETLSNCIAGSGGAADKAKTSENNAKVSENNAKMSEDNAKTSEESAIYAKSIAQESAAISTKARDEALEYSRNAADSASVAVKYCGGKADAISFETKRAKEIHISNSTAAPFKEVYLYGKSEQNGTPTPSNPVPISHIVNPEIKVLGGQSLVYETELTSDEDGVMEVYLIRAINQKIKYSLECDVEYEGNEEINLYFEVLNPTDDTYCLQEVVTVNSGEHLSFPFQIEGNYNRFMNIYNNHNGQFTFKNLRIVEIQKMSFHTTLGGIGDVSDALYVHNDFDYGFCSNIKCIGNIQGSEIDQGDIEMIEPCLFKVIVNKKEGYNNFLTSHYAIIIDKTSDHSILKGVDYGCSGDSEYGYLYIKNKDCATLAEFINHISDCEFVYEMCVPTKDGVISEDREILNFKTGCPYTDIECDTDVKVTYKADTQKVYNELKNARGIYDATTGNLEI